MANDGEQTRCTASLDWAIIERAADVADVETASLVTALEIIHAELIGRHSNLEGDTDYVTVDGRRAYRVHESVWTDFLAEFDFEGATELAVRYAHTEQAKLLCAASVAGSDDFDADEEGIVIDIDTAEQF